MGIVAQPCRADVSRLRPDQLSFSKLLKAMCRPTKNTSYGERWCKQLCRQPQAVQQQGSIELDVGVQSPVRFVFLQQTQCGSLNTTDQFVKAAVAATGKETFGCMGKNVGTGITHAVDAMSKSHEALTAIKSGANHRLRALRSADFEDHVQRGSRRSAV